MNIASFTLNFTYKGIATTAEIRPCCRENNVVDYAVWMDDKLQFTITRQAENNDHWVIALKNADDEFDDDMIQSIGAGINEINR